MESRRLQSVRAVIDFIETHLDGRLNLERTAAAVHYSKYHLHRTADRRGQAPGGVGQAGSGDCPFLRL